MRFASPWAFLLLLVLPVLLFVVLTRKKAGALRFSSAALPAAAGKSFRATVIRTPLVLRIAVLALLIIGIAGPQQGMEKIVDVSRGIAIEMVVDRSSSMGAEMEFDGAEVTRLDVVKKVFSEFINGNKGRLEGRPNDLVGMITFARYADTICPLTLAHGALDRFLDNVRLVEQRNEDGTAIGDAILLAAARLKTAEETLAQATKNKDGTYEIKSKIIVLLTDGENNTGTSPLEAAEQARKWGIKIYTIGVGGEDGALAKISSFFGGQVIRTGKGVDKQTLSAIAEKTGGVFRMAEEGEAMRAIYEEIGKLEKSEVESVRYIDYKEHFTNFALAALALLGLEVVLSCTVFRKIP